MIILGYSALRSLYPIPSLLKVPGEKFAMTTLVRDAMRSTSSRAPGSFKFTPTENLSWFCVLNHALLSYGRNPGSMSGKRSRSLERWAPRHESNFVGPSILMIVAPK